MCHPSVGLERYGGGDGQGHQLVPGTGASVAVDMNGDLALDSNTYCCNTNTSTAGRLKRIITLSIELAAAGAQMEEWWGQLGPCDTALLCTVSRQAGHQPRAHSSGDYHGYYLLFTATPCVDVSIAAHSFSEWGFEVLK